MADEAKLPNTPVSGAGSERAREFWERFGADYLDVFPRMLKMILILEEME